MPETNFRALCEELLQELCCCYKPWELKEGSYSDAMKRANAALAQPEPAPTDEELMAAARKAVDAYPRGSELPYFLSEDSCEYEPMLLALRAAARWSMPTNNIWRED